MLGGSLCFIEACEATIVTFVESPRLVYRNIGLADLLEDCLKCDIGPGKHRRVRQIKLVASIKQGFASSMGLRNTFPFHK